MTYNFLGLDREGALQQAIDELYDLIDGMLGAGRFEEVDDLLRELQEEEMTVELAIAVLTITGPAASRLPGRPAFYAKTAILVGEDADAVLWGLIYKPSDFKDPTGPEWFDELCIYCRKTTGYAVNAVNASSRIPMHADCAEKARQSATVYASEVAGALEMAHARIELLEALCLAAREWKKAQEWAETNPKMMLSSARTEAEAAEIMRNYFDKERALFAAVEALEGKTE